MLVAAVCRGYLMRGGHTAVVAWQTVVTPPEAACWTAAQLAHPLAQRVPLSIWAATPVEWLQHCNMVCCMVATVVLSSPVVTYCIMAVWHDGSHWGCIHQAVQSFMHVVTPTHPEATTTAEHGACLPITH
jgi:hypothetical protein